MSTTHCSQKTLNTPCARDFYHTHSPQNHWTPCVLSVSTTHSQSTNPLNTLCPVSVYHSLTVLRSTEHPVSFQCLPHTHSPQIHWTPCVLSVSTTHSQSTDPLNTLSIVCVYHILTVHRTIEHPGSCRCLPHTHSPQIHWTPPSWRFLQSANTKTTSLLWWPGLLKKLVYSVSWPGCSHTHMASTCNKKNQLHYSETHLLNQQRDSFIHWSIFVLLIVFSLLFCEGTNLITFFFKLWAKAGACAGTVLIIFKSL